MAVCLGAVRIGDGTKENVVCMQPCATIDKIDIEWFIIQRITTGCFEWQNQPPWTLCCTFREGRTRPSTCSSLPEPSCPSKRSTCRPTSARKTTKLLKRASSSKWGDEIKHLFRDWAHLQRFDLRESHPAFGTLEARIRLGVGRRAVVAKYVFTRWRDAWQDCRRLANCAVCPRGGRIMLIAPALDTHHLTC